MAESFKRRRWIYMITAMLICICAGFGYAWSVFQNPFIRTFGWKDSLVSLTYTITVLCSTLTSLLLGAVIRKLGIRKSVLIGGIMFGVGLFLTGILSHSIWELYLFYGFLTGVGTGLVYPQVMSYVVRIFPEKTGLASGLGTAAYGSGAIIWAPLASGLIQSMSLGAAFRIFGIGFFVIIVAGSFLLVEPPSDLAANTVKKESVPSAGLNRAEMVRTGRFYCMVAIFTFALVAGVLVISQASSIVQVRNHYSESAAALFVSVFSAANMAGRFLWGSISDRIGKANALKGVLAVCTVSMALMAVITQPVISVVLMAITASCYGGTASVLTPITAEVFGAEHITENYGVMYIVFGIASLIGPLLATSLKDIGPTSYTVAFIAAAVLACAGLILSFAIKLTPYKKKDNVK